MRNEIKKNGFTLLEVLTVVIIIGILAALGWSSMNELIQTNKAKEAARTMTAFVERALAEGKTRKAPVTISIISNNTIQAEIKNEDNTSTVSSELISNGFTVNNAIVPTDCGTANNANKDITSVLRIGTSGITGPNCFIVCSQGGNYCGGTVKTLAKNNFTAHIKKRACNASNCWEAL